MGKIRIKAVGDIDAEKKQQEEARKRAELKRAEKTTTTEVSNESPIELKSSENIKTKPKSKYAAKNTKAKRSTKYQEKVSVVDKSKFYLLAEALTLLPKLKLTQMDESVELHINTTEKGISGSVVLPHGNGKKIRIAILNQSEDPKAVEDLIKKVESGIIDFDVLLATPDSMPKLAKVARFLGPKGLMPNPKNGTVTPKPTDAAKRYEGGQVNYKTEAKFPVIHLMVGKLSFGNDKLEANIKTIIEAVQVKNIKDVTLKSTMSPGIKLSTNNLI
jgi:large subunit ribosomal protein L1